jgi:GT2 family glycosyltransferase
MRSRFYSLLDVQNSRPLFLFTNALIRVPRNLQQATSNLGIETLRSYVIIVTKGRPREVLRLIENLQSQTTKPAVSVVVGTEYADIAEIEAHPFIKNGNGITVISDRIGITGQRNFGMETLEQRGYFASDNGRFFCVFFDDDFRMDECWIEQATQRFEKGDIVGLTGKVLADGVKKGGINEKDADSYIRQEIPSESHWASGTFEREIQCAYGCNMAFLDSVVRKVRFDEELPLYGWQEDRDYTGMARKYGKVIYTPKCVGVHLGVKSARVSGVIFGYAQIANPLYLMKKGTMSFSLCLKHLAKAIASNLIQSCRPNPLMDHRGRLRGNIRAIIDTIAHGPTPQNVKYF